MIDTLPPSEYRRNCPFFELHVVLHMQPIMVGDLFVLGNNQITTGEEFEATWNLLVYLVLDASKI
jgi:hypothetical protein